MARHCSLLLLVALLAEVSMADVEQDRLERARAVLGAVTERYRDVIHAASSDADPVALGTRLWRRAVQDVRAGSPDDRALYWARLGIQRTLSAGDMPAAERLAFERASRGMHDAEFPDDAAVRVLVTGFDPFHLDEHVDQSNPSGLAALALDGARLATAAGPAVVEAAILPVRFEDFDAGIVEGFFGPRIVAARPPDLLLTVSMGRDRFDLERFPGRRRSAEATDNRNVVSGASPDAPRVPLLDGRPIEGPEFLEFSLPADAMRAVSGRWGVRDNRDVVTVERGALRARSLSALDGLTAVAGSGGGYLSNEVAYRVLLLARDTAAVGAVGHLHTPRVAGYDGDLEAEMVGQIRALLTAAVEALTGAGDGTPAAR